MPVKISWKCWSNCVWLKSKLINFVNRNWISLCLHNWQRSTHFFIQSDFVGDWWSNSSFGSWKWATFWFSWKYEKPLWNSLFLWFYYCSTKQEIQSSQLILAAFSFFFKGMFSTGTQETQNNYCTVSFIILFIITSPAGLQWSSNQLWCIWMSIDLFLHWWNFWTIEFIPSSGSSHHFR